MTILYRTEHLHFVSIFPILVFLILFLFKILLLEALKANRCDYVRVLLDQGVKLTKNHLPELYEQVKKQTLAVNSFPTQYKLIKTILYKCYTMCKKRIYTYITGWYKILIIKLLSMLTSLFVCFEVLVTLKNFPLI